MLGICKREVYKNVAHLIRVQTFMSQIMLDEKGIPKISACPRQS
jgi:hypothetical protein